MDPGLKCQMLHRLQDFWHFHNGLFHLNLKEAESDDIWIWILVCERASIVGVHGALRVGLYLGKMIHHSNKYRETIELQLCKQYAYYVDGKRSGF